MNIQTTELPGVLIFEPKVFGDERGFFVETCRQAVLDQAGLPPFVQHNQSRSSRGVLRGLHYQMQQPQGKLVRVARGAVYDVAVDIRRGSPTFGRWVGVLLDDVSHRQFYVPPDFAHGFVVLSEVADFVYLCTNYYHPASEAGIIWNDPDLAIAWPDSVRDAVLVSAKDAALPRLCDQTPDRLPVFA